MVIDETKHSTKISIDIRGGRQTEPYIDLVAELNKAKEKLE